MCDFGLSRRCIGGIGDQQPYTDRAVTLCYRVPELLLQANGYSAAVDSWSEGYIMAERLVKASLFPVKN